ncbi:MAG: translational GTPase TypA [Erysipelotrichales bacterium]|nr:translational GTPase TypA [Erysipelotrichales bacterium]
MKIRNIAIIAHVDHGKTTLVDQLLKQSESFRENEEVEKRVMDSNDLEKERGMTILAKTTAINFDDYRINIVDTPGHADFSGEVERIMHVVDGVLLVVDAAEGTMPQTRFVLQKALLSKLKPVVIINKVDRRDARIKEVIDEVYELFIELGANEEDLDFPILYLSALKGTASSDSDPETQTTDMSCVFKTIIETIPAPKVSPQENLQLQIALLDYNDYLGRMGIGLITKGTINLNEMVTCIRNDGSKKNFRVMKIIAYNGIRQVELKSASAGDIVLIAGLADISVGETINKLNEHDPLPPIAINEPTMQMTFGPNTSPFAGEDGKLLTVRKIEERLLKEAERDVSLKFSRLEASESFLVSGRGELHLGILIENMRREGFELQVSKPEVILKEIAGIKYEPYEKLYISVPEEYLGNIMEAIGQRSGELLSMDNTQRGVNLYFIIPSQGLIGFTSDFMTLTKGYGITSHNFFEYRPYKKKSAYRRPYGVLVALDTGKATAYCLGSLEERGVLFIEPGCRVYEGMVIGECNRVDDLAVNAAKQKALTNMRAAGKDATVTLKSPRTFSLEASLDYLNEDELVEVTPKAIRIRKKVLNTNERKKIDSQRKWQMEE